MGAHRGLLGVPEAGHDRRHRFAGQRLATAGRGVARDGGEHPVARLRQFPARVFALEEVAEDVVQADGGIAAGEHGRDRAHPDRIPAKGLDVVADGTQVSPDGLPRAVVIFDDENGAGGLDWFGFEQRARDGIYWPPPNSD